MDTRESQDLVWIDIPGFEGRYQYCFETKQIKSLARKERHGQIPNNKMGYGMYRSMPEKILKAVGKYKKRYFLRKTGDITRPYTLELIEELINGNNNTNQS